MSNKQDLSVIILTYNEEIHIKRCIESVGQIASSIFVVDSFSTDKTIEIAKGLNANVIQHTWENSHAKQFNWALDNLPIKTKWVLKLDADEYITQALQYEIENKLSKLAESIDGIVLPLQRYFLGKHIKYGTGTVKLLRIFKFGSARAEEKMMDEHITLITGKTIVFNECFADNNLKNLGWWTAKHNGYAIKEAIELIDLKHHILKRNDEDGRMNTDALKKRKLKLKYAKKPLFFRAFLYFMYRYFFKLGFLDGKEGFLWNFLQGWWYRTLVDAKIYEIKKACGTDTSKIKHYIKQQYQIEL